MSPKSPELSLLPLKDAVHRLGDNGMKSENLVSMEAQRIEKAVMPQALGYTAIP